MVNVTIDHPKPSDLTLYLVAPDGTKVLLAQDRGGSTANAYTNTTFDDSASTSIAVASPGSFAGGTFQPEGDLSDLEG